MALARLSTGGNPHFSIEKGEQLYRDALEGMKNSKDPAIVYETGYLYETWAAAEFESIKTSDGLEKLGDSNALTDRFRCGTEVALWPCSDSSQTQSRLLQASDQGQDLAKKLLAIGSV